MLTVFAPLPLLLIAALSIRMPGRRPDPLPRLSEAAGLLTLLLAAGGVVQLLLGGGTALTFGPASLGLLLRLDAVSAVMTLLVGFVGWIVLRFSRSYLDGEDREGLFHGLMLATIAAVLVLVQSGGLATMILAFVAVGAGLRRLLLFYADRAEARRAAAKFRLVWAAGDLALLGAAVLVWAAFGTLDFGGLSVASGAPLRRTAGGAIALIVLAALLKTAAFPLHGWLTEVMEAPTPVSALLHAGIINAGGFVLIRMADLVQTAPGAMAVLVLAGGFTALFGALVMLTQSAVKTGLAWSTVAQMGFMLLQCGLGLWALALLHIVAHSLYKAHSFLSSGSAVRAVLETRRPGPVAVPGLQAVARAFVLAIVLYAGVATGFWAAFGPKTPQALALGAILIFGVAYLVAQGLADAAPAALTRRTAVASTAAALAYFGFHGLAGWAFGATLPTAPAPGPLETALVVLTLGSFGAVAVAQSLFPHWAHHPASAGLRVHLANGLYANAVLDRLIGGFRGPKSL
ncbi:NADH-quinone oxidoreductase subunit L/NAD(P)H-quinone oxidoreductase subunit 5 [Cribrihabitans marinus]|uniref:Probable inorganic carbon transporter subunit DabB n=1 Tax=Cribrihabitans marinus TaxID=1227549 RepID=A0A1H6W9T0_9RHOB|nr:proton-conducting transporter membrane subunit [Cribrihabitans marinus]GGH24977.1 NADH dehydrogenase [Cribrihabitans marinus]SEJ09600.1 NADH-quinone oxidoreductase subunit L/NAD(P)H-quinone oxidoreductase subunit 5 [Cribrihabitans marinus]